MVAKDTMTTLDGLWWYATVMWPKPMIDEIMVKIKDINKVKKELK